MVKYGKTNDGRHTALNISCSEVKSKSKRFVLETNSIQNKPQRLVLFIMCSNVVFEAAYVPPSIGLSHRPKTSKAISSLFRQQGDHNARQNPLNTTLDNEQGKARKEKEQKEQQKERERKKKDTKTSASDGQ